MAFERFFAGIVELLWKIGVIEKKKWLTEDEFMEIITVAESTPGPIAINVATYVGYKKKGFLGSLFATLGVVLPSLVIIFVISLVLDRLWIIFMSNMHLMVLK